MSKKKKTSDEFVKAVLADLDPEAIQAIKSLCDEGFEFQNLFSSVVLVNSVTGEAAGVDINPAGGRASTIRRGLVDAEPPEAQTVHDYLETRKPAP